MPKRIAVIDREKCRPDKCDKPCIRFCPRVRTGDETVFEKNGKVYIAEELCVGCGICTKKCPKNAITIINIEQELSDPIHQYGKNSFRLYGLPIPEKGKVVGLLGANGIGKTTALQILSGNLKPNLGNFDKGVEWDEIIAKFKGSILMTYLKDLRDKKIRAVYKPQQVDKIPASINGKVSDLLKDERKVLADIAKKLEIESILLRNIADLSGGELQRVAIAAAICKDADFYYFDEPSSFLDVRHRVIVAKAIKELAAEKAVLVVEHDLATLDILADIVHLVYGHAGVYGIISAPYHSLRGINTYLDGFIREENIRFRQEALDFRTAGQIFKGKYSVVSYPEFRKKFMDSGFSLKVDAGSLMAGEIVGVFGANALGKTTFAKMLAGEVKPDNVDFAETVRIAYKPQYLKSDFSGTVGELLSGSVKKFLSQEFKMEILRPLELEGLLDNRVASLSGGELQRVAIAICLGQDVEFYLLDEPSAYLDVEQRVKFAKMMRKFVEANQKTCMIIDHDMLLLHYVSDRSIIFFGKAAIEGHANAPKALKEGMNEFLKDLNITFRRETESGRPRANKPDSQKDTKQKEKGVYYE
ncbi:Trehalose/maltose import ATP-binding protein MalK [uncultured archaeon]|nr:Trehalose/maltose import ATP-binding protein MalK [uncultured archaeon]